MTTDSFFALAIAGLLMLFLGFVLAFAGYRFFVVLLPVFGFLFGFGFGAQTVQALFGEGFLSTVSSWLVGLLFAISFALFSYLFFVFAVALVAGAMGYALGAGVMQALGFDFGFLVWLVGLLAALAFVGGALVLNVQKYVVIAATAVLGAGLIVGTFLYLFGGLPAAETAANPVRAALQSSPLWLLVFLGIATLGGVAQYQTTRRWEVETFNRLAQAGWSDGSDSSDGSDGSDAPAAVGVPRPAP
jgi:hypothetical protein